MAIRKSNRCLKFSDQSRHFALTRKSSFSLLPFFFCIIKYLSDPTHRSSATFRPRSNDLSLLLLCNYAFLNVSTWEIYIGKISLSGLRIHNGLQFVVKFPSMSTLQIIIVRLEIFPFPGFHVIFVTVPSRIFDHVLVACRVLAPVFLRRFHLVVSQL